MSGSELLYLSRDDVSSVGLTMDEAIELVEQAFREKGNGRIEMPPKPGIHPGGGDSFIHAMPASIPAMRAAGLKWVSGYPRNPPKGLPYITGLLILNDIDTGLPVCVMDCVWITAMRTAAASAVAARFLARSASRRLGVLGCGVQGRTHVEALRALFPLDQVLAYDVDAAAASAFCDEVSARHDLAVAVVDTPQDAVAGCDLIVTAGPILKTPHRTIKAGWWDRGAFASLVDFDAYWHPDALREASKFCTDDIPQLDHYRTLGYFQEIPPIHADLGELVTGQKPGRETDEERTIACNLGLAIDDVALAPTIYRRAVERSVGTRLPL